jgi:hypothetical protein
MAIQDAIDAGIIFLKMIVDEAQDSVTKLKEADSNRDIKIYTKALKSHARDIYSLAVRLEVYESVVHLDDRKEQSNG